MPDDDNLKEDLIEMKSYRKLQLLFSKLKLKDLRSAKLKAFPSLAMNAMTVVLPFLTTYFCKSGFLTMMYIKNKHRKHLQLEDDLRILWSKTEPSFEGILKMKQQQKTR